MRPFLLVGAFAMACGAVAPAMPIPAAAIVSLEPSWPTTVPAGVEAELDRAAETHRVFGIGEGDHYVADKYGYRLALLRPLVERHGLRNIALEMGASDASRIDRYLVTGDERWLHRVVLYGFSGETPAEQREIAPVTRGARRACDDAWAEAERGFFRTLRASTTASLRVFGFDYDTTPGGGYADARDALAGCSVLRDELTPPVRTTPDAEEQRLDALVARIDDGRPALDASCGGDAVGVARDALAQLAFSYRTFFERFTTATDDEAMRRWSVAREERMFVRFAAWRGSLDPDAKIAILAHDMHVARDAERLRYGRAPHDSPMWESLGTRIERDRPGTLWVSWLLYGEGSRYDATKADPFTRVALRAGSLESALAATPGRTFVVVDRVPAGSPLDRATTFGTETSEGAGPVRTSTDVIAFLPSATAPPGCAP